MLTGITTWYRADGPLSPARIEDIYWGMVARLAGLAAPVTEDQCSMPA